MNGSSLLLDTNIILYLLSGNKTVADILDGVYPYISFISELELLGYNGISTEEKQKIKLFLNECHIIDINDQIKTYTIGIREAHTLKLPDSIIASTSLFLGIPLFTADKGFAKIKDFNMILYEE